jgi:hypothetical protein
MKKLFLASVALAALVTAPVIAGRPAAAGLDINETKSVVRAGFNFRFGGWGKTPVAARY